jgi:hypothetical protein
MNLKQYFSKNKLAIAMITIFLILSMAATTLPLPLVDAHTPPWTIPTLSYISVSPNPIGVGQQALVVFWINEIVPTSVGQYGDRYQNMMVIVTKPDGSNETFGPFASDPTGSSYMSFVPDKVGTYTFVMTWPGMKLVGANPPPGGFPLSTAPDQQYTYFINDTMLGSTSLPAYLNVQQEPVQSYQETPLPTDYWTVPVNSINRQWYPLIGNWLSGAAQNVNATTNFGYGAAPESAHILWSKPYWVGGIMDARYGDSNYYGGISYENYGLSPPIILNGKIYYTVQTPPREGQYCVDLYTGNTIFFSNTTGAATGTYSVPFSSSGAIPNGAWSFGQILDFESPNQHGGIPYLWSTASITGRSNTYDMFDANTGNYICSIANVSSGTAVYGKDGSILRYNLAGSGTSKRLTVWNSTWSIVNRPGYMTSPADPAWLWRPQLNYTFDGNNGYSLNVSIPNVQGSIIAVRENQYVIGGTSGQNDINGIIAGNLWALNLDTTKGERGSLLWNITYTPPVRALPVNITQGMVGATGQMTGPLIDPEYGVFSFSQGQTGQRWGYSLSTGQLLWGPTTPEDPWSLYGMSTSIYQGIIMSYGYSGQIVAYNETTGTHLWTYNATAPAFESPYSGGRVPLNLACIADGKMYVYSTEHSASQPLWRGSDLRCINVTDGSELWKINHWGSVAVSDGYLVGLSSYDNEIYCYGKGPSATTVTVQNDEIAQGNSIMIKGTVTDQSPGAKNTPAIADSDQQAWMEYLYMQRPMPTTATGVPVTLSVLDANNNYREIGTTTSNADGFFSFNWTPDIPGVYTIYASFAGSKSYGSSHALTAFNVAPAPESTAQPTTASESMADQYFLPMSIGIIIAIIVVGALLALLLLRKRP